MTPQQIEALERLVKLKEQGEITPEEFETAKKGLLTPLPSVAASRALPVKRSTVWGPIAVVIGVLILFTPRFLVTPVLIALFAFALLGLVRDGSKILAVLALIPGLFIVYGLFSDVAASARDYEIEYQVMCAECEVRYSNQSGGTDEETVVGSWKKRIIRRGDEFVNISAQNSGDFRGLVEVYVMVDGKELKHETSSGRFSVAQVYFRPEEINSTQAR